MDGNLKDMILAESDPDPNYNKAAESNNVIREEHHEYPK